MDQGYVYLNELNSNSKNYSVKVRVVEKSRPKTSFKKAVLFQTLLLADEKGNKMKAALFGEQVHSFNEAIVYNGQYIISNAPIKLIEERWRSNSDDLPFQMTFGGQTVLQRENSDGPIAGPAFQSIQSIPRILIPGTKYDVLGIVLYVEDKVRVISATQGRDFHVREIVITDQTMDQPLVITTWNDLAEKACDTISLYTKTFDVIGFTALQSSVHKGFSLSTGMSTEIIYDPQGDKAKILREWARFHTQQLLERQEKVMQVRFAPTDETPIDIQTLRAKKPYNVLQEERHWLKVKISQPDFKDVIDYIGCFACGKRINIPVSTKFTCGNCKKKDSISAHRITFKFDAADGSGKMTFTAFTTDTEKLFGISAEEIHLIKDSENLEMFNSIQQQICSKYILVQVGPTTALSRNSILQWCLKGIKVKAHNITSRDSNSVPTSSDLGNAEPHSQDHAADKLNASALSSAQKNCSSAFEVHSKHTGIVKETESETADDITTVNSLLELSQQSPKRSCTEPHIAKNKDVARDLNPIILGAFSETNCTRQVHSTLGENKQLRLNSDDPPPAINQHVAASSGPVDVLSVSISEEGNIKKTAAVTSSKTIPKKRSLTTMFQATETIYPTQRNDSKTKKQPNIAEPVDSSIFEDQIAHTNSVIASTE